MPLDVSSQTKSLEATLHYLKRGAEKPVYYRTDPPPGEPRWNGIDDPREVRIEDARGRESEFTLDRNGFAIVKERSAVSDFYDPEQVKRVYYPEVETLLRESWAPAGCSFSITMCATPRARTSRRHRVRCTTITRSTRRRAAFATNLGAKAPELLKHRFGVVNVWRPIRGPVLDSPLALCDARTFTDDDLIASDLVYAHVRGETSRVAYDPKHRWYYFSGMEADEALLIRVHDSADDGRARLSFHTSFENPLTPARRRARASRCGRSCSSRRRDRRRR